MALAFTFGLQSLALGTASWLSPPASRETLSVTTATSAGSRPSPGCPRVLTRLDYAAYALSSLAFWTAAADTLTRVTAAFRRCPAWWQLPAALLLDPAVLPYTVLLALSLEPWFFHSQVDLLVVQGRLGLLPDIYPTLLHELAVSSWWPLELCRAALELAVAAVRPTALPR